MSWDISLQGTKDAVATQVASMVLPRTQPLRVVAPVQPPTNPDDPPNPDPEPPADPHPDDGEVSPDTATFVWAKGVIAHLIAAIPPGFNGVRVRAIGSLDEISMFEVEGIVLTL